MIKRISLYAIVACLLLPNNLRAGDAAQGTYGQQVVAAVLMAEAWGEGEKAMIAVAEVVRLRADQAGLSPLAVVLKPRQFTCLNRTTPENLIRRFHGHPDFKSTVAIARRMYNQPETLPGLAGGATHFERVGTRAYWTRGHRPVATIGLLAFYKLPR